MDEQIKIRFTGDTSDLEKSSVKATQNINRLSSSIETLRGKLEARKSFLINETDIGKIAIYNKEIAGLKGQIDKIQKIGVGDGGLGSIASGANTAFSSLRKLAFILPGIGVAGLINDFASLAVQMAQGGISVDGIGQKLGLLSRQVVDTKAVFSSFGEIFKESAKKSGDDIVKLEVYKEKLNDVNIPATERLKILKEYNSIADKTNQIDASQINNLELINQKIDAQNSLIIKRALTTAALSKITEAASKLLENEMKLQEEFDRRGFKDLTDYEKKTNDSTAASNRLKTTLHDLAQQKILNPQGLPEIRKGLDGVVNPAQNAADAVQQTDNSFNALVNSVKKGRGDLQNLAKNLGGLITVEGLTTEKTQDKKSKEQKTAFLFDFLPFDPTGNIKPEQRGQLLDAINKFQKDFHDIIQGAVFLGTDDQRIKKAIALDLELKSGKAKLNLTAIRDQVLKGVAGFKDEDIVPPDTLKGLSDTVVKQFVDGFNNSMESHKGEFGDLQFLPTPEEALKNLRLQLSRIGEQLPKEIDGTDVFGNKRSFTLEELVDFTKISPGEAIKAIQNAFGAVKTELDTQADSINNAFKSFAENAFSGIGDSIGNALATGADPIQAAADSLISTMGDLVEQIGKALINYGVVKTGLDKVLDAGIALPGAAAIAIGISAVAIGSLIKSSFKKFAKGGFVPGSGNGDTVPALLTPGEFVVPKRFARMIGGFLGFANGGFVPSVQGINRSASAAVGGDISIHVTGNSHLRGKDVVFSYNQTVKSQRRAT